MRICRECGCEFARVGGPERCSPCRGKTLKHCPICRTLTPGGGPCCRECRLDRDDRDRRHMEQMRGELGWIAWARLRNRVRRAKEAARMMSSRPTETRVLAAPDAIGEAS